MVEKLGEKIVKHLMRIYSIIFLSFGLVLLIRPNLVMNILGLPYLEGHFWSIMAFTFLLLIATLSWQASINQEYVKFILFIKFASAITYISFGLFLLTPGLIIGGVVDLTLGCIILICKKL
ncbi:MAG: hypothetical protein ACTSPD_13660 [Promethearchaeota archaeon]